MLKHSTEKKIKNKEIYVYTNLYLYNSIDIQTDKNIPKTNLKCEDCHFGLVLLMMSHLTVFIPTSPLQSSKRRGNGWWPIRAPDFEWTNQRAVFGTRNLFAYFVMWPCESQSERRIYDT